MERGSVAAAGTGGAGAATAELAPVVVASAGVGAVWARDMARLVATWAVVAMVMVVAAEAEAAVANAWSFLPG
eukprot:2010136-Prymnesium_polylepis.1